MNIININSRFELSPWQIAFTESVLRSDRNHCRDSDSLYHIAKKIPFYLVDKYTFSLVRKGSYHILNRIDDKENRQKFENEQENIEYDDSRCPETELLGYYVSKGSHGIPEIYLCTESIIKCTKDDEELTYLIANVIIHELAHAYMDMRDYGTKDEFYEWMEEGFANKITLEYFRNHSDNYRHRCYFLSHNTYSKNIAYNFVTNFILKQPDNYKLGFYLHIYRVHSHFWYNHKDDLNQKQKAKAAWLNYVKSNIRSRNFDAKTFYDKTTNVLLEDPYNEIPKDER